MMTHFDDLAKIFSMEIYGREAPWWGEYMAQYREAAKFAKGAVILDVGCGRGFGSRELFDRGAMEVLGVDIDGAAVALAQAKNARDGVEFKVLSAADLSSIPKKFDLVTCFQVLEKTSHPDGVIQDISRLLNPKGILILSTVNRSRFSKLHEAPADPNHFVEFNIKELTEILKRHFAAVEIQSLFCTRQDNPRVLSNPIAKKIPFALKDTVFQKVMGQTFFPTEDDYILTKTGVESSPLFYAICKKA